MKYELLKIGAFSIKSYGLMIAVGILAGMFVLDRRARKKGLDPDFSFSLAIWCMFGGFLGAKLLFYLLDLPNIIKNPSLLFSIDYLAQGFVVYGGIIIGILTGYLYCKKKGKEFPCYFDMVMPIIALIQGFGRIGCFLAGCCYGKETDAWYGLAFHSPFAPEGVKLIPTQLISSLGDFTIFFILSRFDEKEQPRGQMAARYMMLYSGGRFFVEFLRGDPRGSIGPLSTSQVISIFICAVGTTMFFAIEKRARAQKEP